MVTLKDGTEVEDSRLDRLVQFDERSRNFPIRTLVERKRPRSYTWRISVDFLIDQSSEGACVGFAVANELMARPAEVRIGNEYATNQFSRETVYWGAQRIDPWDGGSYPGASPQYEGTSVLAGIKIAHELGYFDEYRWSFDIESLVLGVGYNGPALIGINWYRSNYWPDQRGYIRPEGDIVGGHAVVLRAVKIKWKEEALSINWRKRNFDHVDQDASYFTMRNSWGQWGKGGDCYITVADMARWLQDRGEAAFMVKRSTVPE